MMRFLNKIPFFQMYGRYTKDLGEYAKDEARRLKQLERQRKKDDRARDKVNKTSNLFPFLNQDGHKDVKNKATVVGNFRSFSANSEKEKSFALSAFVGGTRLLGWVKTGYS